MTLPDVNILVYAHREDSPHHAVCHAWLLRTLRADQAFGLSDAVLSSLIRIVTHPKIFKHPTRLDVALAFVAGLLAQPHAVIVGPGPRHWRSSRGCAATPTRAATWWPTPISRRWRSNRDPSGSRPTETSRGSPG